MLFFESVLWFVFRVMSLIADLRQGMPAKVEPQIYFLGDKHVHEEYLWVFCSTIGELNACKPLINEVCLSHKLVLLTDRECYKDVYNQHFSDATVVLLSGRAEEGAALLKELPPKEIIVCEIPCVLHDAPCRLSYGLLRNASKSGVKLSLVNGWLYNYGTSCRMDAIEHRWFNHYYVRLFDLMVVQTESVRQSLISFGACEEKVKVAENIKFDSLNDKSIQIQDKVSEHLINKFSSDHCPVIIAGCITDLWEFELLLKAYIRLRDKHPEVRIVLAPRHPENTDQMLKLRKLLTQQSVNFCFKSELLLETLDVELESKQVLILDTIGELKSYYSCGDVCYVGRDHNILEPLVFGKSVVVVSGWNTTYPSYPVYRITKEEGLIHEINCVDTLFAAWEDLLFLNLLDPKRIIQKLGRLSGGAQKTREYMSELNCKKRSLHEAEAK